MKHLLPPNILQPPIQILDLLHDILDLALIRALQRAGLANGQVQGQLDPVARRQRGEPAPAGRRGREAQLVVARVGGREGEAPGRGALLGDHAVVVVEDFLGGWMRC